MNTATSRPHHASRFTFQNRLMSVHTSTAVVATASDRLSAAVARMASEFIFAAIARL